ncbi:o-succinylbenzoate synthase [Thermoplasmatales archaeon AK]|nr:o-succinylbenzoate synthase [Thermoplasmatales archaeon AK]
MPMLYPFTTSFGTESNRNALIFELKAGDVTAYSECVTSVRPDYGYEDNTTALHVIEDVLVPMIKDLPTPEEFTLRARKIKGDNMAKGALEMLLWDYHSKLKKKPLHEVLGKTKGFADVGLSIGMDRTETTLERISKAVQAGYQRIKVKIEKGKEVEILKAVRDNFPEIVLTADANSCYSINDIDLIKKIDRFELKYLEQPLSYDDLIYHSRLAREISTPICLDESITSPEKAQKAFEIGACSVVNIKPGRIGGLTDSVAVARIAREFKGHVWVGGMLETGIGRSFNVAMASLELVDYPGDTAPNSRYFKKDIVRNQFIMENGRIKPNSGPGIGVDLDHEELIGHTVMMRRLI